MYSDLLHLILLPLLRVQRAVLKATINTSHGHPTEALCKECQLLSAHPLFIYCLIKYYTDRPNVNKSMSHERSSRSATTGLLKVSSTRTAFKQRSHYFLGSFIYNLDYRSKTSCIRKVFKTRFKKKRSAAENIIHAIA